MSDNGHVPVPTLGAADDKVLPLAAYALMLGGFVTGGVTSVVGLIIAYANRDKVNPLIRTHYVFAIRTCWMGLAIALVCCVVLAVSGVLSLIVIGIPFFLAAWGVLSLVSVWFGVRCALGLYYLLQDQPYPRPDTWLI